MDYPLVLVEWIDAAFDDAIQWDGETMQPWSIRSIGWLTKTTPAFVTVAHELQCDPGDKKEGLKYRHVYPREMVKKVTLLETGATWQWPTES